MLAEKLEPARLTVEDDGDVNDDGGESVYHGQFSHLALGYAAVLSRRKLGGCALLILRQPTSDAGGRPATIIVKHLAQSPPTAAHCHCYSQSSTACCTEACGWSAEGDRLAGSETALQVGLDDVLPVCRSIDLDS